MRHADRLLIPFVVLAIACGEASPPGQSQPEDDRPTPRSATVAGISIVDTAMVLDLRREQGGVERRSRIRLVPPPMPAAFTGVVVPSWSGPCDYQVGESVFFAEHQGLGVAIYRRRETATSDAHASSLEACFVRLYFDLGKDSRASVEPGEALALGLALRTIAELKSPLVCWIRGSADQTLGDYYRHPAVLLHGAQVMQDRALEESVPRVRTLVEGFGNRDLLVRAVPVVYQSWREKPIGGGWPYFATAVFQENPEGHTLTKLFEMTPEAQLDSSP